MQIRTINVIEIPDKSTMAVQRLVSFQNDNKGVSEAEETFAKIIRDNYDVSDEEMSDHLENGYFEDGDYYIMIVHSTG
jgi:hypothetical protein